MAKIARDSVADICLQIGQECPDCQEAFTHLVMALRAASSLVDKSFTSWGFELEKVDDVKRTYRVHLRDCGATALFWWKDQNVTFLSFECPANAH
jgi:hypothetical protein